MSYLDVRSDLFQRVFRDAVSYRDYLTTGNDRERAAWARAEAALPALPDDAQTRLDPAGRLVNVLCLSGIWCGDCVRSVPIVARLAEAAGPSVDFRLVDRDAIPELRDELRVLGAMRVPMVVFLTEDFHEIGRYGDRPLTVYREKAATELGAACPLPGSADGGALAAETNEWLDVFERMILMARLAPPLRARHGD
jgi:thiol-disulfide isomerase/thioredoxin